ncbi:membrane protein [Lysinibacillus alkalisoli]|uniref:Membrane protein n=1 Tax=Lysinibacillus alkalisoli TaxID=1911548 RepID=A0A917G9R9_9BACI|nr:DUF4870 domain-containing protein [Lysinibacillus alkalisoli]GGG32084.1 membrane protein [Lysinibacillus alkalisoli]
MENNRVLSALNYFSLFFAPFLFPVIVWILVKDTDVRYHAKRALLSHLIPFLFGLFFGFLFLTTFVVKQDASNADTLFGVLAVGGFIFYLIITIVLMIWNIVQGLRLLRF